MKTAVACLLFACLAVAVFAQNPAGSAGQARGVPGAAAALAAQMGGAAAGGAGGADFLTMGALTGTMGDGFRDMMLCQMMNLPRFLCLTRMMQ